MWNLTGWILSFYGGSNLDVAGCSQPVNGVVGDCAWGSQLGYWGGPMGYLLFEGRSHERFVESESFYRTACTSREIFRVVNRPTISDGTCTVAMSIGLDNRELLPPYTPMGRGLDILFGINLWKCFEDGYLGHVPSLCSMLRGKTEGFGKAKYSGAPRATTSTS